MAIAAATASVARCLEMQNKIKRKMRKKLFNLAAKFAQFAQKHATRRGAKWVEEGKKGSVCTSVCAHRNRM